MAGTHGCDKRKSTRQALLASGAGSKRRPSATTALPILSRGLRTKQFDRTRPDPFGQQECRDTRWRARGERGMVATCTLLFLLLICLRAAQPVPSDSAQPPLNGRPRVRSPQLGKSLRALTRDQPGRSDTTNDATGQARFRWFHPRRSRARASSDVRRSSRLAA